MGALTAGPHEVESESFTLDADGRPVPAYHARPLGAPRAGIVVHPDIMGLRPLFEEHTRRLASHGYSVATFEPFGRYDPDQRSTMDLTARFEAIPRFVDSEQLGDMARAAEALVAHDDIQKVAVLGFCMGGMYALKAAGTGRFDRAVSFYGQIVVPEAWRGPELAEPLATAADACPTIVILGDSDPWTPAADVDALRDAWADRSDCEVVVYRGADHGFVHDPNRPAHRAEDAADAWRRVLTFLDPMG